ncbi:MAG: hypothetical protein QOG94_2313 [Solirubrobacteraceae bacterium]|nr:hypothetical protein [Solirubrobacteraceae bacterium]
MSESYTWGISGPSFLWLYAGLCVATAVAIWLLRRRLLNAGDAPAATPAPGIYEIALLNGGPQLAIAAAATKLHDEGSLASGPKSKTIVAATRPAGNDELEHEVYGAVERTSGMSGRALRRQLEDCDTIRRMAARLVEAGLLLDDERRSRVNALWLLALPLLALGIARAVAGAQGDHPIAYLVIALVAVAVCAVRFAFVRTRVTARGQQLLDNHRGGRKRPAHTPIGAEIPLAVALFGTGVLWEADPAIASAWSVPREHTWTGGAGSGGGCGGGGGGCGGGGCGG